MALKWPINLQIYPCLLMLDVTNPFIKHGLGFEFVDCVMNSLRHWKLTKGVLSLG